MKATCEKSNLSPEDKARVVAYLDRIKRDLDDEGKGPP
jgi:hypothetical protein